MDEPALVCKAHELAGLPRRQRERLLADDVLPGLERRLRLRVVQVVRRRDVDDVDAVVLEQRLVALVRLRQARLLARALGRRPDDARHVDTEAPQGLDVDDADEARSDDGRPHPSTLTESYASTGSTALEYE